MNNKKRSKVYNTTVQHKLIKKVDTIELSSRKCLDDIDRRLYDLIFAYSGSLDYGSLQILETILIKASGHLANAKKYIAQTFVEKDLTNHPELKQQVAQMIGKVTQDKPSYPFNRN